MEKKDVKIEARIVMARTTKWELKENEKCWANKEIKNTEKN